MKEEKEGGRNKGMQISILSGQKFPNFHHELKTVCDSKKKKKNTSKNDWFSTTKAVSHYLLCPFAHQPPCSHKKWLSWFARNLQWCHIIWKVSHYVFIALENCFSLFDLKLLYLKSLFDHLPDAMPFIFLNLLRVVLKSTIRYWNKWEVNFKAFLSLCRVIKLLSLCVWFFN